MPGHSRYTSSPCGYGRGIVGTGATFRRYSPAVRSIARQVVAEGQAAETVAAAIVEQLRAPDLRFAFVFSDWRLDPATMARMTRRGLAPAATVGATTIGVIARDASPGP